MRIGSEVSPIISPEPTQPDRQEAARKELDRHLEDMLTRIQSALPKPVSAERAAEIREATGEYILGLIQRAAAEDPALATELTNKGMIGARGTWDIGSPIFTTLVEQMMRSMPARLEGFQRGMTNMPELHRGVERQIRNLVRDYRCPGDTRRPRPIDYGRPTDDLPLAA